MVSKKKIWIVSEYYYPVKSSTGYYITEIAEFLSKKKHNVHVICTDAKYNENDELEFLNHELINGVLIYRVSSPSHNKNNFYSRTYKFFSSSLKMFFKLLLLVKRNDKILVVTNPAFLILLMPILKWLKSINYNILVHDIFPENLAAIGKINKKSLLYRFLKMFYDFAYSKAEMCIVVGRDMKDVIAGKIGKSANIVVIPNWSDTSEVKPLPKLSTKLIEKIDKKDKFIFQFAGNLGHLQGLENIISAIKSVKNKNIHFLFIGSGALEELIQEFIKTNELNNVTLLGFQNRNEQNDFLNACDVAIVTLNDGMYGLGVPSKAYNIMACGKPLLVVADVNSEISLCVKEHNIGWVVNPSNPLLLSYEFERIYNEFVLNGWDTVCDARKVALKYFSKDIILNKYECLLSNK
jgi:glycosyltransferase involved in cell wall biosynthesis